MNNGPLGTDTHFPYIDDGTMCRARSPNPGPTCGFSSAAGSHGVNGQQPFSFQQCLRNSVDKVPELQGFGIILIDVGGTTLVRDPGKSNRAVVVKIDKHQGGGQLPDTGHGQEQASIIWREVINLGFNCGGATLSWIGVAGFSAATPVTGGLSVAGAVLAYGGAVAVSGQCVASGVRVYNELRDDHDTNERMDKNPY